MISGLDINIEYRICNFLSLSKKIDVKNSKLSNEIKNFED